MTWTVAGFEKNKRYFEKLLAEQALAHAYLFTGQEMIGKRTFALDLARIANGFLGDSAHDPDRLILDRGRGMGIDEVRTLRRFLSLRPYVGRYRLVIIDEAEGLREEAASALLKVLEEPPASALIFLISANPRALLPTIFSRTMEIKFAPHPREELIGYLGKMDLSRQQAEFLADFANGRLGLAYRLQQSNGFKDIRKNLEQFHDLTQSDYYGRLVFAEKIFAPTLIIDPLALLLNWMFYLRSDFSKRLKINRSVLLRKMIETHNILSKPQYNHRLAFENLLLML